MKVVLLAGGFGTRLSEETGVRPKPMIEIGGLPLLLHIMKNCSSQGFNDFVVCLGYMGYYIKEYFSNYALHRSDVTYDFGTGKVDFFNRVTEDWRVTLIDTGINTMTGGRLKRVRPFLGDARPRMSPSSTQDQATCSLKSTPSSATSSRKPPPASSRG
jgi:glucose-1-phosphate cytidylyltransferase